MLCSLQTVPPMTWCERHANGWSLTYKHLLRTIDVHTNLPVAATREDLRRVGVAVLFPPAHNIKYRSSVLVVAVDHFWLNLLHSESVVWNCLQEPQKDSHLAIRPRLFDFVLLLVTQWLSIVVLQANDAWRSLLTFGYLRFLMLLSQWNMWACSQTWTCMFFTDDVFRVKCH